MQMTESQKEFLPYHSVREDLASATSFTLVYLDLQFWFSFSA